MESDGHKLKIAYIFPGQGAQYVGMGREIYEKYESARKVFSRANEILGFNIAQLCFEGPTEHLVQTRVCQPAIFAMSLACYEVLKEGYPGLRPQAAAGLSLGEFTALVVAGGLSFEDGLRIVQARAQYMHEACQEKKGAMASVLGLDYSKVKQICDNISQKLPVTVANVNCPGQIVISGGPEGVQCAIEEAKRQGAKRAIELQVSGAFHSSFMESARLKLEKLLSQYSIQRPKMTFISNVLGRAVEDPEEIKKLLVQQVTHSVLWEQGILEFVKSGFNTFIEVGCGKVLSGLQRKIAPSTMMLHIEDEKSLSETKNSLVACEK